MPESEFAALERKAAKPADELLDGFLVALAQVDTETLSAIADYRHAIHPDGWMQRCIREYLDVWR
jgi:hypothetical protein